MFPDYIYQNIDILAVIDAWKNNFGFHSNRKTQGHKHQLNNLYFKYQVYQMKLRHLNTFLQFRLIFHEPHCMDLRLRHQCLYSNRHTIGLTPSASMSLFIRAHNHPHSDERGRENYKDADEMDSSSESEEE